VHNGDETRQIENKAPIGDDRDVKTAAYLRNYAAGSNIEGLAAAQTPAIREFRTIVLPAGE